jgi:DNA (cytosine-5)-methyltransferase 1
VDDHYHQLKLYPVPKPAYDPRTFLKGCITTSGTTACHPSGERQFTPRELSLFQSFPYIYKFTGTKSEATKQIGNAFPPIMAQALYETIAKTLNVFDEGIIGAEDDLSDLDALLNQNGGNAPQQQRRNQNSFASMNLLSGTLNDNFADRSTAQVSSTINRRHEPTISDKDDEVIYISSDSE